MPADKKHLAKLMKGAQVWNAWREFNFYVRPNLQKADIRGIEVAKFYLGEADLAGVDFSGLTLSNMCFDDSDFTEAIFNRAILKNAKFTSANLFRADLVEANLENAELQAADIRDADLRGANLKGASLRGTNFTGANLYKADLTGALATGTIFGDNDLSVARGLETLTHEDASVISIETLYRSQGNIPEIFLRGCGLPEDFITQLPALIASIAPIQFYKSFISYSSKDQKFADRLYADLQNKGVRCWLATEDLKIGAKIRTGIDEAIRLHDKLLLVLSKHSVTSDWVEQEVETALERERKEKRLILFPIRLDDAVMKVEGGWPALIRNTRNIGDFRKWKDHDDYHKSFAKLLHGLRAKDKQTAEG
jgi:hypothetical protein